MNSSHLPEILTNLLTGQRLAVLSTQMSGQPYSNLIAFVAVPDMKEILFATDRATRKFANLTAEPRVSLLVDDRRHLETDFQEASAVTVLGTAAELLEPERQRYLQLYLQKHPHLREFVTGPTCALIRVTVAKYILVTRFQEVQEIVPAA